MSADGFTRPHRLRLRNQGAHTALGLAAETFEGDDMADQTWSSGQVAILLRNIQRQYGQPEAEAQKVNAGSDATDAEDPTPCPTCGHETAHVPGFGCLAIVVGADWFCACREGITS